MRYRYNTLPKQETYTKKNLDLDGNWKTNANDYNALNVFPKKWSRLNSCPQDIHELIALSSFFSLLQR